MSSLEVVHLIPEPAADEAPPPPPSLDRVAPADRVRRAARHDCPLVTLREYARDPDIIVRATVALSGRCDPVVDAILIADEDERVRALLASRVARLLGDLASADQDAATQHVHRTLRALAMDEAIRVRVAIADELASVDTAPHDVVLQLAHDGVAEVSDRVIRLSPLLSDADLLAIIATPQSASAAESVASRKRLSTAVTDAIVQQADVPTIKALLHNQSACIRESMLDLLVGRAPDHIEWHAPLVRRPSLSVGAVRALSEFITCDLLHILATRADLEPAKLEIVRQRLALRSGGNDDVLVRQVQQLRAAGTLDEAALRDAARAGDTRLLLAQLAVCSGVALSKIERLLELRSAKALVSVVWRGGFSMGLAADIQRLLAQFGPEVTLTATSEGKFPLSDDEMVWQLELLNGVEPEEG